MKPKEFSDRLKRALLPLSLAPVPLGVGSRHRTYYRLVDGLVLMLIVEVSKGRMTASWWIGATFAWGYVPPGVPMTAYRRVPTLLSLDERREIIGPEDVVAEGYDYWWDGVTAETLAGMLLAVQRTAERFLVTAPRVELLRSAYYTDRRALVQRVCAQANHPGVTLESLGDPATVSPWASAAELVIGNETGKAPTKAFLRELAEDAALCAAVGLDNADRCRH